MHITVTPLVIALRNTRIHSRSFERIRVLWLPSVAAQAGLSLTWSNTWKTGFLLTTIVSEKSYVLTFFDTKA